MNKSDLRIVFFGTSDFGCPALDTLLLNQFNVVGVVTKPDFHNQRKKRLEPTPVKIKAQQLGIPVLEPTDLRNKDFQAQLGAFNGNVFIVVAYQIIPQEIYSMAKYGTFNIHASLLPDYRGAAPINWMIANGEKRLGLTSFFINDKIDEGDIICQMSIPNYPNKNFTELYNILSTGCCGELCCETLNKIISGEISTIKQQDCCPMHKAPKLTRENTRLDFSKDVNVIFNSIRAFSDKPGAWCNIISNDKHNNKSLKILSGEIVSSDNGFVATDGCRILLAENNTLLLQCTNGMIKIKKLQLEGCNIMNPKDFINGYGNSLANWVFK